MSGCGAAVRPAGGCLGQADAAALHTQDDNAIFADTLGRGLLSSLHVHTAIGALVGLYLTYAQPLGRIPPSVVPCRAQGPLARPQPPPRRAQAWGSPGHCTIWRSSWGPPVGELAEPP